MSTAKFKIGQTVITPNARDTIHPEDVFKSLSRHTQGDWGDVGDEDRAENELSLKENLRLFSVYHDRNGTRFWIITEADRSSTNVELNIC